MPAKITKEILEAYLNCELKAHLKLTDQSGIATDYAIILAETRQVVRADVIRAICECHRPDQVVSDIRLTEAVLRTGPSYLFDATFEDEVFSLTIDGLKRVDGPSNVGAFHYAPILFHEGREVGQLQRLQLEIAGRLLANVQGRPASKGIVWCAGYAKPKKIRLNANARNVERLLRKLRQIAGSRSRPALVLNGHCRACEFREPCQFEAIAKDNLSLLQSLSAHDIKKYNKRGLSTVTQLAYSFKPRPHHPGMRRHEPSLKALAIRDSKLFFYGNPVLPDENATRIYLDFEGDLATHRPYLVGILVSGREADQWHSLWARDSEEELVIFSKMVSILARHPGASIFHYGHFEVACLKRMASLTKNERVVGELIPRMVNVLGVVGNHVYFPTYSNGLKDICGYLGFSWTDADASGLQAVVWRKRWQQTGDASYRERLQRYNREDCLALKSVTDFIYEHTVGESAGTPMSGSGLAHAVIGRADDFVPEAATSVWNRRSALFPDFERLNRCAYFDYQRDHVFVRGNKSCRRIRKKNPRRLPTLLRPNKRVVFAVRQCPHCGGRRLRTVESRRAKLVLDLVVSSAGVRRYVIKCMAPKHRCVRCSGYSRSTEYAGLDKHGHALKSWAIYQHIVHRTSFHRLSELFRDLFGLPFHACDMNDIRQLLARIYRPTYDLLVKRLLSGRVLHADETAVKLKQAGGYIWVFADFQRVVYLYRPDRKGLFLKDFLTDFRGVLVSDFYGAYDGLPCQQQKCLIHLMRDINADLLKNPFDGEFKDFVDGFSALLKESVSTIDNHGLKARFLKRHKRNFDRWVLSLSTKCFNSDVADSYCDRILRNRDRLFTFAEHDDVPWNNSNAEHAIRAFAINRDATNGCWSQAGLESYLILLSIRQTCAYQGVNFLDFLLSREMDIDGFAPRSKRRRSTPSLDAYPADFKRSICRPRRSTLSLGTPATDDQRPGARGG